MRLLLDRNFNFIPTDYLAVCEGHGDACFVEALLKHAAIDNCSVGCPSSAGGHGMGISAIPKYLDSVRSVIQLGRGNLRGIVVIVDADNDPAGNFKVVGDALAGARFPSPAKPFYVDGEPVRTAVFLVPGKDQAGTLEHLLWKAAIRSKPSMEECVDTFLSCAGDHHKLASENKRAKMKMASLIAASCYDNPGASLGLIWSQKNNPVPIDSPVFKELSDFLTAFLSLRR